MRVIDWEKIKKEYIAKDITTAALAKEHGVGYSTLRHHITKGKWSEQRADLKQKSARKTMELASKQLAEDNSKQLVSIQRTATALAGNLERAMTKEYVQNFYKEDSNGKKHLDVAAVRSVTASIKDLAQVLRDVYEILRPTERSAMEIAAERLTLDKQRADAEDVKEINVTFEKAEWSE